MHPIACILLVAALLITPAWADGDFVVLAREPDADAPGGFAASVWRLDEEAGAVIPVARLEPSVWSPRPLHPARPDLIRLQIPDAAAPRGYRVAIYHLDRADWTARAVWRGRQALPAFEHAGAVYVKTSDEHNDPLVRLRFPPGAAEPEPLHESFEYVCPVANDARHHIIGRGEQQYLYDAAARTSRRIGRGQHIADGHQRPALSPDGSHLAFFIPGEVAESADAAFRLFVSLPTSGTIVLLDLRNNEEHRTEAWVYTSFGSGRNTLVGPDLFFDNEGMLHFRALPGGEIPRGLAATPVALSEPLALADFRLDPNTKAVEQVTSAAAAERPSHSPDDGHETAWAFLNAHGIEAQRPPAWTSTKVGFTADRGGFLLKCSGAGLDDTFFLADRSADTLTRIPAPPELRGACDLVIIHLPDS